MPADRETLAATAGALLRPVAMEIGHISPHGDEKGRVGRGVGLSAPHHTQAFIGPRPLGLERKEAPSGGSHPFSL